MVAAQSDRLSINDNDTSAANDSRRADSLKKRECWCSPSMGSKQKLFLAAGFRSKPSSNSSNAANLSRCGLADSAAHWNDAAIHGRSQPSMPPSIVDCGHHGADVYRIVAKDRCVCTGCTRSADGDKNVTNPPCPSLPPRGPDRPSPSWLWLHPTRHSFGCTRPVIALAAPDPS